jgi:hypothetical protein
MADIAKFPIPIARQKTGLERAREILKPILEDPAYLDMLKMRANAGSLSSGVEQMLFHYVYGKVVDKAEIKVSADELEAMTDEQLIAELNTLKLVLEQQKKKA